MPTLSVPLSAELTKTIDFLVESGVGSNKADVVRRALKFFAEEEAVQAVLRAEQEPSLEGDLDELARRI